MEVETLQSQILFIALLQHVLLYILFRPHLDVQIGLLKYRGQKGCREDETRGLRREAVLLRSARRADLRQREEMKEEE